LLACRIRADYSLIVSGIIFAEGRLAGAWTMQKLTGYDLIIKTTAHLAAAKGVLIITLKGIIMVSEALLNRINVTDRAI
jgi:hypothetical protein